ncbi:MAG: ribose-phosphate pyrophosphokinase [Chloroflexi bacterium]|nr:ribose-phosphate pyrophosphokinase [Chloroflexota bacterium]MBM3173943.1 ribose-phosphate pyrophosphokinase [Chloroflexota bacterium]MBM3176239.1 ribose-phosphate pyrophosphokinase [Chloroflexota bacterium]MBM4449469.1 ribose-phosphate pyrophosphokinase [Chloroflexota bacterium]
MDELKVFTGNAHPSLAKSICEYLGIPLGKAEVFEFTNENIFVRILENVRERDVFVIQPLSTPVNKNLVELLIMIDAFKRASAGRITAVIPYYGYSRTDKKDQPRVPITARLIADLLTTAGANRLLTIDLHAAQIQGFFNIPVDELTALFILSDYWKKKKLNDLVVVATDIGISKRARDVAEKLNAPLAIMEKRRVGNVDATETLNVIGDVEGMRALTVDDEIDTAGSLINTVNTLLERGATEVYACCTHPIFSGPAIQRISKSPVKEVVVADTVPVPENKKLDKITVLPTAPLLGEAIHRIHTGLSVGAMFE